MLHLIGWKQLAAAIVPVACFVLLLLPIAASRQFDWSIFIFAGDHYVRANQIIEPIAIVPKSLGYDGQFYYRLALDPFSFDLSAYGITFDAPAKRMQRIIYPALAWLLSIGDPARVPVNLLIVNILSITVVSVCAAWLTSRRSLAWWLPIVIVWWPGFFVAFAFDTAEIVTAALILVALAFYLSEQLVAYSAFAAAAILTRETAVPIFFGIFVYEACAAAALDPTRKQLIRIALSLVLFMPLVLWWATLSLMWGRPPQTLGSPDLGWPLVGLLTKLLANVFGIAIDSASSSGNLSTRLFVVFVLTGSMIFCSAVIARLPEIIHIPKLKGIAYGWLLTCLLMSLLTANGPLVEPISYFRAFSECWLVGCFLLAHIPAIPAQSNVRKLQFILASVYCYAAVWKWIFALQTGLI